LCTVQACTALHWYGCASLPGPTPRPGADLARMREGMGPRLDGTHRDAQALRDGRRGQPLGPQGDEGGFVGGGYGAGGSERERPRFFSVSSCL
jgi:hypothetical protein